MLKKTLNEFGTTSSSPKSFNNKYGVPLSLFNLNPKHEYGVFEIGMSKFNEINKLSSIVKPDIGIITNISEAHLENFKSIKEIAKAKSEIIYNINGEINFDSTLDIPLPIGFIDNDIVINELDIIFSGELKSGIKAPSGQKEDGYGKSKSVFEKYLIQELEDIDGTVTRDDENPSSLQNAESITSQSQFTE